MRCRISTSSTCAWMLFFVCSFFLSLFLVTPEIAAQEIAPQISYQGRILDAAGQPLAGPVDIEIAIYQSDIDPSPSYRELHSAVPLEDGVYSILIGQGAPLDGTLNADVFTGGTAMLEVTINDETLSPRQPFASSAYAFRSLAAVTRDLDIQGGFRVQAGSQYFTRSSEGVSAGSPRCECDLDSASKECGDAFFSNQPNETACYDWYDDFIGGVHHLLADQYGSVTAPVSLSVDSLTGAVESGTSLKVVSEEPTLVLRDTNGGGIRPRIRFENNGIAVFEGDDAGDQYFNFYSTFQPNRSNSAHLRVHGAAADSWGKYTELSHDGVNGKVTTDAGDLILETNKLGGKIQLKPGPLGRVKIGSGFGLEFIDGTLQTTAYRGYPRPAYDSDWRTVPSSTWGTVTLTHDLGGIVDNYVVELLFKNNTGIYNRGVGGDIYTQPAGSENEARSGGWWKGLTASVIKVTLFDNHPFTQGQEYFRVRIWVYE